MKLIWPFRYASCFFDAVVVATPSGLTHGQRVPLSACEVWIGSSTCSEGESSRLDDFDEDALRERDGIGVVYIPLGPNENKVPGFDPSTISTWRREVTSTESQALLDVAEVNNL